MRYSLVLSFFCNFFQHCLFLFTWASVEQGSYCANAERKTQVNAWLMQFKIDFWRWTKLGGQTEKILGLLNGVVGAEFMQNRENSNTSAMPSEGGLWLRKREDHVPF